MLTVVCWLWSGWRPVYEAQHVNRLQDMLGRHLTIPHRLVCATDQPKGVRCETVPVPTIPGFERWPKHLPNCFRRLFLFSGAARDQFGSMCLSMDLDCIIVDNIDSLITTEPFKILRGGVCPYNGSMWQIMPGWRPDVWSGLDIDTARAAGRNRMPNGRRPFGSDQVVMAHKLPGAPVWTQDDGIYQYSAIKNRVPDGAKIIFFAGKTKPWDSGLKRLYQK